MKIFVTVGTTKFDGLIEYIDNNFDSKKYEVFFQIADGKYIPKNFPYVRFVSNIKNFFLKCDIVITHAGAGSIYELLELNKKIIIVPNLERKDKHQLDIALFMEKKGYAKTILDIKELNYFIERIDQYKFKKFKKEKFFKADEILNYLLK